MILDFIKSQQFFPVVMIVLNAAAAARYVADRNVGQTVYWSAAFALNFAVTFLMGRR